MTILFKFSAHKYNKKALQCDAYRPLADRTCFNSNTRCQSWPPDITSRGTLYSKVPCPLGVVGPYTVGPMSWGSLLSQVPCLRGGGGPSMVRFNPSWVMVAWVRMTDGQI